MADFDFEGLREQLAQPNWVLVVAEREAAGGPYRAWALDTEEEFTEDLRLDATSWLQRLRRTRLPVDYQENTLLAEHEVAVGEAELIDADLLTELRRAARERPQQEGAPDPRLIRLYAFVAVGASAVLLRRQNPVRHLTQGVVTRLLQGTRLEEAPPIFVYDGRYDLVVWAEQCLIVRDTALDAVFLTDEIRLRQTKQARLALARHLRPADEVRLREAVAGDAPFATKLRKIHRGDVFDRINPTGWQPTIEDFTLGLRVEDGRLVLPENRPGRWELLSLIEDGFVRGAASGTRYRSNSQRVWQRRLVTHATVREDHVTRLGGPGAWGSRDSAAIVEDIHGNRAEYVMDHQGELHVIVVQPDGDAEILWAGSGENLLLALPELED